MPSAGPDVRPGQSTWSSVENSAFVREKARGIGEIAAMRQVQALHVPAPAACTNCGPAGLTMPASGAIEVHDPYWPVPFGSKLNAPGAPGIQRSREKVPVFVTLDQPGFAEVRLWVQANSRDDVTVMPDNLAMGRVKRSTSPTASTTISFFGDANWQITGVASDSNYVQPLCKLVRRDGVEVAYQLSARLRPDTPVGKWYTDLWLTTNNPATPRVRVPLNVEVESGLSVSPGSVVLGPVKPGKETQQKVIVRGVQPFRITRIQGTDRQITVRDSTPAAKDVHVLTITFRGNQPGDMTRTFRVSTDLVGENDVEFTARAQVVP